SRSRNTKIGPAVADQNCGQSSSGVDRASDRALTHPAPDCARGVAVWKSNLEAVVPEFQAVRKDGDRQSERFQRAPDRIVQPIADNRDVGKGPNVVDE